MEPKTVFVPSWEDIVFQQRNKAYGAYQLRKLYTRRLLLGLGVSVSFIAFMVVAPGFFNGPPAAPAKYADGEGFTIYPPPPNIPKRQPAAKEPAQKRPNTQVIVTRNHVDTLAESKETNLPAPEVSPVGDGNAQADSSLYSDPGVEKKTEDIMLQPEVYPMFQGGYEAMARYLKKNLRYPVAPRRGQIEGTVYVSFVVMGDGTIADVAVVRGFHRDCDNEAVRVISAMPAWAGGKHNGVPVRVKMMLPIRFRLQ